MYQNDDYRVNKILEKSAERFLTARPGAQKNVRKKKPGRFIRNDIGALAAVALAGLKTATTTAKSRSGLLK
jgi:hypothetical protein